MLCLVRWKTWWSRVNCLWSDSSLLSQSLKDFCSVTIFSRGIGYGHWIVFQDKILSQSHIQTKPKYFSNCKYTDRINITQICDCYIFLVRTTEQVYLSLLCWTMLWMKGIFSLYISWDIILKRSVQFSSWTSNLEK